MNLFRVWVLAFVGAVTLWTGARAATIVIDDSTDNLTVSLNGRDLTTLLINGLPPGTMVGPISITGGLILTGAGCNAGSGAVECAVLRWDDPSVITTFTNSAQTSYASPIVALDQTTGTPNSPPTVSDFVSLTITTLGDLGTEFLVTLDSDANPAFPSTACASVTGCVDLGLETGGFQDVTTALLTPVANCIICTLPNGLTAGALTAQVRSDLEGSAPEPAMLALLGIGLAGLGFSRRKH